MMRCLLLALCVFSFVLPPYAGAQEASVQSRDLVVGTYGRLVFEKEVQRVAAADEEVLSHDLLTTMELLVLGKAVGRTNLIVWYVDGTTEEFLYSVRKDLSVLQSALKEVHPSLTAEIAPDRDAVVLRGLVPDYSYSRTAEDIASRYLGAGNRSNRNRRRNASGSGQQSQSLIGPVAPDELTEVNAGQGNPQYAAAVINLIQLSTLPPTPEERIQEAIWGLGGENVTVRRVQKGPLPDFDQDILILEGRVGTQVQLLRILTVAAQSFGGTGDNALDNLEVIGDEAGALAGRRGRQQGQGGSSSRGGGGGGGGGGLTGVPGLNGGGNQAAALFNRIQSNLGRAKAISLANGRILSFIDVEDLPQVRVQIKLIQVNRTRLRTYGSDILAQAADFDVNAAGPTVNEVFQSLSGNTSQELLISGDRFLIDSVITALESEDIARSLSQPALMVLSGEIASFQVGGQVPIPVSFAPAFGGVSTETGATPGVFNGVQFAQFGIQLGVRPLVDENDVITLDVMPQIVSPDAGLTQIIRDSTGTNPATIAFETRSLRTSARLQDGQSLLVGGLLDGNAADGETRTPGLGSLPLFGWLFKGFTRSEDELELIILVNPVIVRDEVDGLSLWHFPDGPDLLREAGLLPRSRRSNESEFDASREAGSSPQNSLGASGAENSEIN